MKYDHGSESKPRIGNRGTRVSAALSTYLWISSIACIFSESLVFHFHVDVKAFYFVLLFNYLILIFLGAPRAPRSLWVFLGCLIMLTLTRSLVVGDLTYIVYGFPQIAGIAFVSIYFFSIFSIFGEEHQRFWKIYLRMVTWVNLIGFPLLAYAWLTGGLVRFHSVFLEPAHYATVVMPAFCFFLENRKKCRKELILISAGLILTLSLVAYVGVAFCFLLCFGNRWRRLVFGISACILIFFSAYASLDQIRTRVNDTIAVFETGDLANVNLSTYAFMSNFFIAIDSLKHHPGIGVGLGRHEIIRERYLKNIPGSADFLKYSNLNAKDANSLFIRVMSECGIFGLLFVALFIVKYYGVKGGGKNIYSNAVLSYFFLKLLREGHYFPPELYFFVAIYYFSHFGREFDRPVDAHLREV